MNEKKQSGVSQAEFQLGYLYRTVEEQLNAFAEQEGCPYSIYDIALRMGDALRAKAEKVRQELRNSELLLKVRKNGALPRIQRTIEPSAAIHVRTRTGRTLSEEGRKNISLAQKARWAKTKKKRYTGLHWTQKPENKARLKKHLKMMRLKRDQIHPTTKAA